MCICCILVNTSERFPFVLCSVRDEMYTRPTSDVKVHPLSGTTCCLDEALPEEKRGTWLAINHKLGTFSLLTNSSMQGRPEPPKAKVPSRGLLVLSAAETPHGRLTEPELAVPVSWTNTSQYYKLLEEYHAKNNNNQKNENENENDDDADKKEEQQNTDDNETTLLKVERVPSHKTLKQKLALQEEQKEEQQEQEQQQNETSEKKKKKVQLRLDHVHPPPTHTPHISAASSPLGEDQENQLFESLKSKLPKRENLFQTQESVAPLSGFNLFSGCLLPNSIDVRYTSNLYGKEYDKCLYSSSSSSSSSCHGWSMSNTYIDNIHEPRLAYLRENATTKLQEFFTAHPEKKNQNDTKTVDEIANLLGDILIVQPNFSDDALPVEHLNLSEKDKANPFEVELERACQRNISSYCEWLDDEIPDDAKDQLSKNDNDDEEEGTGSEENSSEVVMMKTAEGGPDDDSLSCSPSQQKSLSLTASASAETLKIMKRQMSESGKNSPQPQKQSSSFFETYQPDHGGKIIDEDDQEENDDGEGNQEEEENGDHDTTLMKERHSSKKMVRMGIKTPHCTFQTKKHHCRFDWGTRTHIVVLVEKLFNNNNNGDANEEKEKQQQPKPDCLIHFFIRSIHAKVDETGPRHGPAHQPYFELLPSDWKHLTLPHYNNE